MAHSGKIILLTTLFVTFQYLIFSQVNTKKYDEKNNLINWPREFDPKTAKFYVYNDIEINASPETVWDILVDATKWHTYYKGAQSPIIFLDSTSNVLKPGISFKFHTMELHFEPTIEKFVPQQRLAWEVRTKNITGYHAWLILKTEKGCKLITAEAQNGFLTFMQKVFQPNKLLNLHEHWLEVIKERAENTTPVLSNIERNYIKEVLNHSLVQFNNTVSELSSEQLSYKAAPGQWNIAEIIEHITLVELEFQNIINQAMQKPANQELRRKIKIKDDDIRPKMTSRRWKAKSPEIFQPSNKFLSVEEAVLAFENQRNTTISYIANTQDDLRNRYWKHPLTGTIDLYQTLLLMSAHLELHVEQMNEVKTNQTFPIQ